MLEGTDVSQRPWFNEALRGNHVGDVHEAVLLSKLLPKQSDEPLRFVDVAFPYNGKDGKGVLGAHLSWQWAREVERSIFASIAPDRQVEAMIVGADGRVLLGPPQLQGKRLEQPSFRDAGRTGRANYLVELWPDGREYLVGISRTKGYAEYPGLGWTVMVRQSVDNAYLPVIHLRQYALWSGVALALLFSVVGVFIASRITHPLKQLAQSAHRIQDGETRMITPSARSYSEVKGLAASLNALVGDLLDLNGTLEKRVEERTRELASALAAVQANEQRINTIIETAQDAFVGVDLQGKITDWNSQAQQMFGWSQQEAVGQPLAELLVPARFSHSVHKAIHQFNETGHLSLLERRVERVVINRHGQELAVEMTVGLAGTNASFFGLFLRDISARKQVERMRNEFIGTMSHELRTLLTSMLVSLELLAAGVVGELTPDMKELVDIAHRQCERLIRLIKDVFDVQRMESGNLKLSCAAQSLQPFMEKVAAAMQGYSQQAGVAVVCECMPGADQLMVDVDPERLVQVLTNLLSNAIKFSLRGSQVTVSLSEHTGRARLSVLDHGCGIPEEFRERMFQPFAQAETEESRGKGGAGLGLSICRRIVEAHGGELIYADVEGGGTVFHVDLPLAGALSPA